MGTAVSVPAAQVVDLLGAASGSRLPRQERRRDACTTTIPVGLLLGSDDPIQYHPVLPSARRIEYFNEFRVSTWPSPNR